MDTSRVKGVCCRKRWRWWSDRERRLVKLILNNTLQGNIRAKKIYFNANIQTGSWNRWAASACIGYSTLQPCTAFQKHKPEKNNLPLYNAVWLYWDQHSGGKVCINGGHLGREGGGEGTGKRLRDAHKQGYQPLEPTLNWMGPMGSLKCPARFFPCWLWWWPGLGPSSPNEEF